MLRNRKTLACLLFSESQREKTRDELEKRSKDQMMKGIIIHDKEL